MDWLYALWVSSSVIESSSVGISSSKSSSSKLSSYKNSSSCLAPIWILRRVNRNKPIKQQVIINDNCLLLSCSSLSSISDQRSFILRDTSFSFVNMVSKFMAMTWQAKDKNKIYYDSSWLLKVFGSIALSTLKSPILVLRSSER